MIQGRLVQSSPGATLMVEMQVQEKIGYIPDNNFGYLAAFVIVVAVGDSLGINHQCAAVRYCHYFLLTDYLVVDSSYYSYIHEILY